MSSLFYMKCLRMKRFWAFFFFRKDVYLYILHKKFINFQYNRQKYAVEHL